PQEAEHGADGEPERGASPVSQLELVASDGDGEKTDQESERQRAREERNQIEDARGLAGDENGRGTGGRGEQRGDRSPEKPRPAAAPAHLSPAARVSRPRRARPPGPCAPRPGRRDRTRA